MGARRDARSRPRRRGARAAPSIEPLPADSRPSEDAIAAAKLSFRARCASRAAMPRSRSPPVAHRIAGRVVHRRPGALLSGNAVRAGAPGRDAAASSSTLPRSIPAETQDIVARVLGIPRNQVTVRVPAHGRRVRRQGSAGQSVGRHRRARRMEDEAAGARAPAARARHGAHRQAPSVSGALHAGFDDDGQTAGVRIATVFRWRLEPRSFRARPLARAMFHLR